MFDDPGAFDGIVQALVAIVAAFVVVNAIVLTLATWGISHWARKRGRRGGRFSAFAVALGAEVFAITTLVAVLSTRRVDATVVGWTLGSAVVLVLATSRLCGTPRVEVSKKAHPARSP
jgi:hypothetical protein